MTIYKSELIVFLNKPTFHNFEYHLYNNLSFLRIHYIFKHIIVILLALSYNPELFYSLFYHIMLNTEDETVLQFHSNFYCIRECRLFILKNPVDIVLLWFFLKECRTYFREPNHWLLFCCFCRTSFYKQSCYIIACFKMNAISQ